MRIDLRSNAEWKAYYTGRYDDDVIDVLLNLVHQHGDVIDVGAQVGFYTLAFADGIQSGKVHAFEPVQSNVGRLKENVERNAMRAIVDIYPFALGDTRKQAQIQMEKKGKSTTGNAFEVRGKASQFATNAEKVNYKTLDSISNIDPKACRLIKVDIEGGEVNFLRGAAQFILKARPYIFGEFNSFWLDMYDQSFEDVLMMCQDWKYEVFEIKKGTVRRVDSPRSGTEDALLVPNEKKDSIQKLIGI